ncbi:hypothetical protein [Streptomyces fumanus]|uniref:hypothetical protein n=1 Tax=Streptomyces fumanus TaxID=67302 RepID=UPI003F4CBC94
MARERASSAGALLVAERVDEEAVGERQTALGLRERRLAQQGFEGETAAAEVVGGVLDQLGVLRVEQPEKRR